MTVTANNLIWLDLEMTGLEPKQDKILEIAWLVRLQEPQFIDLAAQRQNAISQRGSWASDADASVHLVLPWVCRYLGSSSGSGWPPSLFLLVHGGDGCFDGLTSHSVWWGAFWGRWWGSHFAICWRRRWISLLLNYSEETRWLLEQQPMTSLYLLN